jgi:biopolymer transport protein ExbD
VDQQELVFQLEITVRENKIEVGDRNVGALGAYPVNQKGYDFEALSEKLSDIKKSYPSKTDAAILLESEIPYDTVVQVMDRVRVAETVEGGNIVRTELFPDISIGDAPAEAGGT